MQRGKKKKKKLLEARSTYKKYSTIMTWPVMLSFVITPFSFLNLINNLIINV